VLGGSVAYNVRLRNTGLAILGSVEDYIDVLALDCEAVVLL